MSTDEEDRFSRYNTNVLDPQKLLDLCLKYHVGQVLILSTFYVYGANAYNPAPLDETAPFKASELTKNLVDSVSLKIFQLYCGNILNKISLSCGPATLSGPASKITSACFFQVKERRFSSGFRP